MNTLDGQRLIDEWGVDYFKKCSTFGALSDQAIGFLCKGGRIVSLDDGEALFHAGETADGFYVLLRGQLDCYREVDSEQVPILIVGVGEQIGYVSMIGLFERLGDGKAHGPTVLLHIGSDLFYQLHLEYPFDFGILMLNLSREMARAFRRVTEELIDTSVSHSVI